MPKIPKLRIGLVGCGAFGESHLMAFAGIPFAQVTAVTDIVPERAHRLAERYQVARVTKSFRELCASKEVDAVSVVTTEDQHLDPVLAALENGKHVFVEKPIATRLGDAERMVAVARETGLILMPGHILRFETKYAMVKERLSSGGLGRILSIYARRNRAKGLAAIYKRTPIVLETAINDIDTMLWYTGKKVKTVRGHNIAVEPEKGVDLTWAILRFEDGTLGVLETMWLMPDKTPFLDDYLQVVTTSAVVNIDILNSGLAIWSGDGAEVPDVSYEPRLRGNAYGALREELSYFSLCALEGQKPSIVSPEDGFEAVRVGLAVVESASADREVEVASIS